MLSEISPNHDCQAAMASGSGWYSCDERYTSR
jgi:uncharacterized membrane protein YbjE (DUF340 family)